MSAAQDITNAYQQGFDAKRSILLPDAEELVLLSYEQVDGEVELLSVPGGWSPKQSTDSPTSEVTILVTAREEIDLDLMNQVARFQIEDTVYRVVPGGITPPLAAPYLWQLRGEEIRDNA